MKKPKILLTTPSFRVVALRFSNVVEITDGRDCMGVRRWRNMTNDEKTQLLERVIDHIGDALILRAKRRRSARGGES